MSQDPTKDPCVPTGATIFYAVLVKASGQENSDNSVEKCLYFDVDYQYVETSKLKACKPDAFVRIQQLTQFLPKSVLDVLAEKKRVPNLTVGLFSAVAKTLNGTADMPNTLMSRGDVAAPYVTVPVAPGTTRGVILIFQFPAQGVATELIATSDPEVEADSAN